MASPVATSRCAFPNLPPLTDYPIDGYGGSYYHIQFPIPLYSLNADNTYNTISWADIDTYYNQTASNALEYAVNFGVCSVTLLNIFVLTPPPKRRLPLHSFICVALVFQIMHNAVEMVLKTVSLPASSYYFLTGDREALLLSHTYYALTGVSQISAWASFIAVQACFSIHGRGLMTWLHLHHRNAYYLVLTYLVCSGAVAVAFRLGVAIFQIKYPLTSDAYVLFNILYRGALISYAVSIGSWSVVFFASAMSIITSRQQHFFGSNRLYDMALNLIAMAGLQSFLVPIVLCILELLPIEWTVNKPEQLIIPTVLFLLPVSSLFLSVNSGNAAASESIGLRNAMADSSQPLRKLFSHVDLTVGTVLSRPSLPADKSDNATSTPAAAVAFPSIRDVKARHLHPVVDSVEVELAMIDALDELVTESTTKDTF